MFRQFTAPHSALEFRISDFTILPHKIFKKALQLLADGSFYVGRLDGWSCALYAPAPGVDWRKLGA
jgi:hypothetical protein